MLLRPIRDGDARVIDFEIEFANRAACAERPAGHEQLAQHRVSEVLPALTASEMIEEFASVVETGEPLVLNEHPYEVSAAGVRYLDLRVSQAGELLAYTWRDVTDRHEAEETLRASQERLAEAQRIAHVGSWEWDIATNELSWSDEVYRIIGVDPARSPMRSEVFLAIVHPDDRAAYQRAVGDAVDDRTPYSVEYRVLLPGGDCRVLHAQGEATYDRRGRPLRIIGSVQDITDRTRANAELRRRSGQLATLLATTSDGSWRLDKTGRLLDVNDA